MKRNTVEFGTSVYITSLFCSGKKMGKLSERNRIVEIRKAQAGEPVAFMEVKFAIYPLFALWLDSLIKMCQSQYNSLIKMLNQRKNSS